MVVLQRTIGNRAACAVLQRWLAVKSTDLVAHQVKGSSYTAILNKLDEYHATNRVAVRFRLLQEMQIAVKKWLDEHGDQVRDPRVTSMANLRQALEAEQTTARSEHLYVDKVRSTIEKRGQNKDFSAGFEFASTFVSQALTATEKLAAGEAVPGRESYGEGPDAVRIMKERGLTDAEMLALKIYTVGD
jgi:hypothetical protein